MLKKRIIPVILLKNGVIVQSRKFSRHQLIGSPTAAVERLSNWNSDELIYLDISQKSGYDLNRNDLNHPEFDSIADIVKLVSRKCLMPLTFGGGIRTLEDIALRISSGADKVSINTLSFENLDIIESAAKTYGSQAIVISLDVKLLDGKYILFKGGRLMSESDLNSHIKRCQDAGAGEFIINSIDRDGSGIGFDIDSINRVCEQTSLPVIALGGAGNWEHFSEVLSKTKASAVAAANIFQHTENSYFNCKQHLYDTGHNVRLPGDLSRNYKNI
jgi:cyclase